VPENLKEKGIGVGEGVGVTKGKTAQSKTALKSKVLQTTTGEGTGVGQSKPNIDELKSGQTLVLGVLPYSKHTPPAQDDKHHLVSPVL
jgi:hypothetical protein